METKVIIRTDKKHGDTFVIFPELVADMNYAHCTVLTAWGHSAGNYDHMISTSLPAEPSEVSRMLKELTRLEYENIRIYKRASEKMHKTRHNAISEFYKR